MVVKQILKNFRYERCLRHIYAQLVMGINHTAITFLSCPQFLMFPCITILQDGHQIPADMQLETTFCTIPCSLFSFYALSR
ncbi:hypothetical protein GDO78_014047 [Eleutherodactylus coqui]|uniref:Uncharacterized protein n=1 Tax=Eleutherodactylus coqui TaxID=57060 RepID=A0A8J6EC23_ELECQ|nr:hypothetical protein GDO78_014047 [Eleutherodactylus coqui]